MNSEGTKHKVNKGPFYFSERQTMPRCFGQYVQQQLSVNKGCITASPRSHLGDNSCTLNTFFLCTQQQQQTFPSIQ